MWIPGEAIARVDEITPLVAQWESSTHPAQIRLYRYLDEIKTKLHPLPNSAGPLFLYLHVRAASEDALLKHYDLENHLTPLFGRRCLDSNHFQLVIGTKDASSPSCLTVGVAHRADDKHESGEWACCEIAPIGAALTMRWKEQLRSELNLKAQALPADGPVATRITLRCSARRNWVSLWKPVGDAMGPVLGYTHPAKPYHPRDDRIVRLEFHRVLDSELKNRVEVAYAWRMWRSTPWHSLGV